MSDIVTILKGQKPGRREAAAGSTDLGMPRELELLNTVTKAREAQQELLRRLELETERKRTELEGVRQDAQRAVAELDARLKRLEEETKRFETEKRAYEESLASEGMRKLREVLEEMDAGKAAEMLYSYDLNTTVKVLGGIRKDGRAAILEAILDMDKRRGLTDATGRAGQIMRLLGKVGADGSAG